MADAVPANSALPGAAAPTAGPYARTYVRYAMWLLLAIYIVNFLNRQIITILAEPIKLELSLADWQLGLLTGLAFAMLYTILGIPIARVAEHSNRPRIISAAAVIWSGFTLLCGVAGNFWQILLFRLGMGAGIAGCTPPAHSLIVDYHPLEKRASAIAFYSLGGPIGALVGLVMGGLVYDAYGWRFAFFVAGVPGLVLGVVAFFTLREPRRILGLHVAKAAASAATFGQTLAYLSQRRTYWYAAAGVSFLSFASGAAFMPSFYLRNHTDEVSQRRRASAWSRWASWGWRLGSPTPRAPSASGAAAGSPTASARRTCATTPSPRRSRRWWPSPSALACSASTPRPCRCCC